VVNNELEYGPSIIVATDGSALETGTTTARAGAGIFYNEGNPKNISLWLPLTLPQTNQAAEVTAIKAAVEDNNGIPNLYIESDSKYAINALTKNLTKHEDQGYIEMSNMRIIQATTAALRKRKGKTLLRWVKGHSGHERNEGADQLANLSAQKDHPEEFDLTIQPAYHITGAKLSKMTQSLAYKGIRQKKLQTNSHQRRTTSQKIDQIQNEVEDATGKTPNEDQIWKAIQHPDLSRKARYFLWMTTHNAYRIGEYWLKENFHEEIQDRCNCMHYGVPETMDHILSQCETPGQKEIWELAEQMLSSEFGRRCRVRSRARRWLQLVGCAALLLDASNFGGPDGVGEYGVEPRRSLRRRERVKEK